MRASPVLVSTVPYPTPAVVMHARSLKEEAFKDVLEDSSDSEEEDENDEKGTDDPTPPKQAVTEAEAEAEMVPSADETEASSSVDKDKNKAQPGNFIDLLPPDLLLQCAEYLGDTKSLCRVREVCLGWVLTLDDRQAGQRLWRPLFYRLRASGSIHKATDSMGQQHRQLKVYDLGLGTTTVQAACSTPFNRGASAATAALGSAHATASISTPSPSRQGAAAAPSGWASSSGKSPSRWATGACSNPGSSSSAAGFSSSACMVCGLIQREAYSGRDCEMCASALVPIQGGKPAAAPSPATPRLAYTRVNLSGAGGAPPSATSPSSSFSPSPYHRQQQQHHQQEEAGSRLSPSAGGAAGGRGGATPAVAAAGAGAAAAAAAAAGGGQGGQDQEERRQQPGDARIDWHFLVKRLAEEKRIAGGWGSLHHGWVWLQRALQVRGEGGDAENCNVSFSMPVERTRGFPPDFRAIVLFFFSSCRTRFTTPVVGCADARLKAARLH